MCGGTWFVLGGGRGRGGRGVRKGEVGRVVGRGLGLTPSGFTLGVLPLPP